MLPFTFTAMKRLLTALLCIILVHVRCKCIKWGNTFDVSLESANVRRDCKQRDGRPICCAALMNHSSAISDLQHPEPGFFGVPIGEKGVGLSYQPPQKSQRSQKTGLLSSGGAGAAVAAGSATTNTNAKGGRTSCHIHKRYISSPLELQDLDATRRIESIPKQQPDAYMDEGRLRALLDYVTSSEVTANATRWLQRVAVHMSGSVPTATADDYAYLSRFEVTRTCSGESAPQTWIEWIEPITITARHPFGFGHCWRIVGSHYTKNDGKPRVGRSNVDYVLLQSGAALYNQTHTASGRRIHHVTYSYGDDVETYRSTTSSSPSGIGQVDPRLLRWQQRVEANSGPPKHYMFDAGTSTFDSSLYWFTCGYSQRRVAFDQVYGWEMTLLEPTDYWRRVPPNWKPYWHFHNVPIDADLAHPDNPVRYMQQIATERDFVAFKLDIDHPAMEMPLAMRMLQDPALYTLIDEFFFELHFRCEVMTSCGWGKAVPPASHGLQLDRTHVLQFFVDLRKRGIRAHIWP